MQLNETTPSNDRGPWRDGWYVVVSVTTQMPHRCMVCGCEIDSLERTSVLIPRLARGIISATHWLIAGERIDVHHGRCYRHRTPWGKYAGILAGTISILTLIAFPASMYTNKNQFGLLQAILLGLFAVSTLAIFWFSLTNLRIEKTDGTRVWVGGFGRRFRDTLPPFRKSR